MMGAGVGRFFLFLVFIFFLFFYLTCPHRGRERKIRICDLRFIRHGLQPIDLPFGDFSFSCLYGYSMDFHAIVADLTFMGKHLFFLSKLVL
jgi:hypothetical protein